MSTSRFLPVFLILSWLAGIVPAVADDELLARAEALSRGGAPHLALALLESGEPPRDDLERWSAWQRARFDILRALRDWDRIARHAEQVPADAPADLHRILQFAGAEARLAAGDAEGARRFLRRLIWAEEPLAGAELARAQRFVIRSYLLEGNLTDAQGALARYRAEHGRGEVWQVLHAEILVRAGKPKEAFEVLVGAQSHEARLLRTGAALRAKLYRPRDAQAAGEKLARELRVQAELRHQAFAVAAEAARAGGDAAGRAALLEQSLAAAELARTRGAGTQGAVFLASADDLWEAYGALAEKTGNRARLLIGNDEAWFALAERESRKTPVLARALLAFLTQQATEAPARAQAHDALAGRLFADGHGAVAQALYLRSTRFPDVTAVPAIVRYRLADKALADHDIRLAATLIRDLKEPPDDDDPDGWVLRRARILIYSGDDSEAPVLLSNLLEAQKQVDDSFADRYVQVLFDLQAVGRHREVLPLLEALYARTDNETMRRELLFWQAESQGALGAHRAAAELFLRSAVHGTHKGEDPWGHTARYHAAKELARSGLVSDARDVYARLLAATEDPRRRRVLEREMQQLWLSERKSPTKP